jgi:hypothetical protein
MARFLFAIIDLTQLYIFFIGVVSPIPSYANFEKGFNRYLGSSHNKTSLTCLEKDMRFNADEPGASSKPLVCTAEATAAAQEMICIHASIRYSRWHP